MGVAIDRFLRHEMPKEVFDTVKEGYDSYGIKQNEVHEKKIPFQFERCIIEEASVASFAELLIVLARVNEKALIIGDHRQLGVSPLDPDIERELYEQFDHTEIEGVQTSLFEFLSNPQSHEKLLNFFDSAYFIISFSFTRAMGLITVCVNLIYFITGSIVAISDLKKILIKNVSIISSM